MRLNSGDAVLKGNMVITLGAPDGLSPEPASDPLWRSHDRARPPPQGAQNEEIECALEELGSVLASLGRHSRWEDMSTHLERQGGSERERLLRLAEADPQARSVEEPSVNGENY
jgi:hypothetical protein